MTEAQREKNPMLTDTKLEGHKDGIWTQYNFVLEVIPLTMILLSSLVGHSLVHPIYHLKVATVSRKIAGSEPEIC